VLVLLVLLLLLLPQDAPSCGCRWVLLLVVALLSCLVQCQPPLRHLLHQEILLLLLCVQQQQQQQQLCRRALQLSQTAGQLRLLPAHPLVPAVLPAVGPAAAQGRTATLRLQPGHARQGR
jgi:hypothetical protein